MDPQLAQALAAVAPFLIAFMTKAGASNQVRAAISVIIIILLVVATMVGDAHPDLISEWIAYVGSLAAIIVGVYKTVDALLPVKLNETLFPEQGIGPEA